MKTYWNFILFLLSILFFSCNNKSIEKEVTAYNGIDSQILNIVDSMRVQCPERPIFTIWLSKCNDSDYVFRFFNGGLIPAPEPPPAPIKQTLISEDKGFVGYKKYGDIYLVFLNSLDNPYFDKFVNKDSLTIDEKPFQEFNVYDSDGLPKDHCKSIEMKYFINERDSLILFEGKCLFNRD